MFPIKFKPARPTFICNAIHVADYEDLHYWAEKSREYWTEVCVFPSLRVILYG